MNKFDFGDFAQEPVDESDLFPDASSNRTNLLENFAYELPAPDGGTMANRDIVFNKARSPELEGERLEVADRLLDKEEKKQVIEDAVQDEVDNFQTGRRFSDGFVGGYGNALSGLMRMSGGDEGADMIQEGMRTPQIQMNQQKLMEMARKYSPDQADILEEELEETFVGDLATGAGQLVGQVGAVGTASAVAGPYGGGAMLTGLVVGNNFEGNYNRSIEERTVKLMESYQKEGRFIEPEVLEQEVADIKKEAKSDAYKYLPSAVPELALEAIFMKGAGKLFRGKAGSTLDKVGTFTLGSLAEGGSEALSAYAQNYMVRNEIDPDQELDEGVARDFALGVILGSTVNTASGLAGGFDASGEHSILGDVQKLQKDIYKRAVKDAKNGDKVSQQYVEDYNNAVESIIVEENGDIIKSVSTKGASNTTGGMSQDAILKVVQKQMGKSDLDIHVVDTLANASKIDESLKGKLEGQEGIEGMYLNKSKKIILVADQLNTEADVSRVLRHESIGHLGTEMVTGSMQDAFYSQVGRDYVNTSVGKQIMRDYGADPNFSVTTLGKEIVARVSENHENADYSFKRSIIDSFNSLTNKKFKDSPENDKNILKSIRLAEATLNTPGLTEKLNKPVEGQTDEVNFSKKRKYGIPKDFEKEAQALTAGKPGEQVKLNESHALHQEFHSVVDYAIYEDTGERTSRKPKYFGFTKYEDPDSNSEAVDKDGWPRKFVWAFQPLDNAYDVVETSTSDFDEALAFAESEDMDRRIDLTDDDPSLDDVLFSKSVTDRVAPIQEAYNKLRAKEITKEEYNKVIDGYKPVLPYLEVPKPATPEDMYDALDKGKKPFLHKAKEIFKPGDRVGLRLDIPAYTKAGVWVPTMHGMKGVKGKSHDSVARVTNADFTDVLDREIKAQRIMEGPEVHGKAGNKNPYAMIEGSYVPTSPEEVNALAEQALNDPAWTQVGFDPQRHSYFYNRSDHSKVILHADEVLQIGPLVLAKKATFKTNDTVAFSRKAKQQTELKEGMTRDKDGNIFYQGVPPREWTPEIFKEVGDLYGIKNFGGLSDITTVTDPDSGKAIRIPGGLDGKFTYYDMLWIKNNQPDLNEVSEGLHAKITKKLAQSLTPEKLDQIDHFNRLAFGFLSPNAPLLPNEFGLARIFARDKSGIQKLADLSKSYPSDDPLNVEFKLDVSRLSQTDGKAKAKERKRAWSMVDNAYRDIGIPFDKAEDMDGIDHWDVSGKSVVMFKEKPNGLKLVVAGHDGTSEGKKELVRRVGSYLSEPGHFAELSDGLLQFAESEKLKKLTNDKVGEILGKEITINKDKFSYTRKINALQENKTKTLYGKPWTKAQQKKSPSIPQVPTKTSSPTNSQMPSSRRSEISVSLTRFEKAKIRKTLNKDRSNWNKKVKALFDIGSKGDGGLGIGLTQDFNRLAHFARLYLKDPNFFIKKDDESWSFYVDKVASQVSGFGTKTASFGGVWQDPFNAMISAIDRHMARGFAEAIMESKELKNEFADTIVTKYNNELKASKQNFIKHKTRLKGIDKKHKADLKKAKTEAQKKKADDLRQDQERTANNEWNEKLEQGIDPQMREVKTLDGVMAQAKRMGPEKIKKALGNATFELMSAKTAKFKTKGEVNKNLKDEWQNFQGFIEEPSSLKLMTDAYAKALEVNEEKANELGIPVFPAQWTLWDRIRQRIEPHEIMFPGLNKLPRMGRQQIAESYNASATAGYNIAPQPIKPTGMKPEEMVYFSKKPGAKVDPVTGESKLLVRLKSDNDLSQEIKDELEVEYEVQGHPEVLRKLKPWFDKFKGKKAEDMYISLTSDEVANMEPEAKMLASTIVLKRLSKQADVVRNRKNKRNSPGQMNLDGFSNSNKFDDMAIDLAMRMSEEARSHGRAISILQELGNLNATSLYKFSRNQIAKTTQARVNRKLPEHGEVSNELMDLIKVAREAGFDQMSIEFLRKSAPNLVKAIEKQFAPSLWGAYRKGAVDKLHKRLVAKLNKNHSEGNSNTPLARFTNELITEIGKRTGLNADGSQRKPRPRTEVLRDALLNAEKYKDVWRDLAEQTLNDESLTPEQFTELQEYFGRMPLDPSGKLMDSTMQERMKALDIKLKELARKHLDTQNRSRDGLVKELMFELDLPASMAQQISTRFLSQFNRTMAKERSNQLKKFKETQLGKKVSKKAKTLEQKIIELSNLGAFSDTDMYSALAQMLGVKGGVTKEFSRKIMDASNKIQKAPEGFQRNNATQDLLNIIQNQAGDGLFATMLAIRVANLVSGPSTQVVNLTGNLFTALPMQAGNLARGGTTSPRLGYEMGMNMLHGLSKGWTEAKSIMTTGRGRAGFEMDKYAFDPVLERMSTKNPFSYLKYVHRFMSSMDALFRFSNIEGKASFLAHMEGKGMGKRGKELTQYVMEAIRGTESMRQGAEAQATTEGLTGLNKQRRVNEILESNRGQEIKTESEQFGLRTTYQNKPEGLLGVFASYVAQASYPVQTPGQDVPLAKQVFAVGSQFFMPFIRVVANVQNMSLDFMPGLGLGRAMWHKAGGAKVNTNAKELSEEAYKDIHARHLMGTALAGVLGYLFFKEEEDEENRMFNVTGPGPSNYAQKKTLMDSGWKPYTVTWFGHQFGYKETPFGGFLAFMGGIKDADKYNDDQPTLTNKTIAGSQAFGRLIFDQAFFKGIGDFIDMARADERSIAKAKRIFTQAPTQFLVPNAFYQIDAMLSNRKYTEGTLQSSMGFHLLPVTPGARTMGMPDLDTMGQPVERYNNEWPFNLASRVYDGPADQGLVGQLINHKIIPTKPNQSTKIRENDDELSDLHRAQDLYLYNYYKGTTLRKGFTESGMDLSKTDSREVQMMYDAMSRSGSNEAKFKVMTKNRDEVSQELKRIKKIFDRNPR